MAEDNLALDIDPPDDSLSLADYDIETGIRSSRRQLIHKFEEEQPASSAAASIKKSIRSSIRKTKYYCDPVINAIKYVLNKSKLLIVISIYSVFGAWLFTTLEVPHDLKLKEDHYHSRLIAREVMILNLRAIYYSQKEDREERWKDAIKQFENDLKLDEPSLETDWTFWMAFLYAGTIYTTIGYGNIACKTKGGQIATLLYAFVGIPIMIIILNDLGDFLLHTLEWLANTTSDSILFLGVRWGVITLEEDSKRRKRFLAFRAKLVKNKLISSSSSTSIETKSLTDVHSTALTHKTNSSRDDILPDPPVFSAIVVTFGWIFLAARVFCIWEEWSYFTSIYFFFISCSTIGLGDVTPAHPEYMILAFGVVMVGLSLVTVCINVVQAKLEMMYMELLQKILKDYIAAMESGDVNAAKDMMAGFTGGAKFLLPFMSKNQGAKVMTQFKEDCEAQGIEPPAVLTDIDPNTGKPSFASAPKEEYNDYIEHADDKRLEEKKVEETKLLTKMAQWQDAPKRIFTTTTFGTQTHSVNIVEYVEKASYGLQASPEYSDEEIQTSDCESVDEGIQTWPSLESLSVQHAITKTMNSFCQYDLVEEKAPTTDTGIQPEVSSIFFIDEDYGSNESLHLIDSDDENEDHERTPDHLTVAVAHSQLLQKSVSVESQETVIHVTPTGSPTTSRRVAMDKRMAKKEEKRKEQEARREARLLRRSLRFLKCTSSQTICDREDCASQVSVSASSSACQYDKASTSDISTQNVIETRGRRCQTKLTCITNSGNPTVTRRKTSKRRRAVESVQARSCTSSTDAIESVSSYEDHGLRSLSTDVFSGVSSESQASSPLAQRSVEASGSRLDSQLESFSNNSSVSNNYNEAEQGRTAEVSLNVNLVSRAVNEYGEYLDDFDVELDDNVFESDDDVAHEDFEQFSLAVSTQTEIVNDDATIQTEIYNFEDKLESIKLELEKELRSKISQELMEEAMEMVVPKVENSMQTNSSSFYAIPQSGLGTIIESSMEDRSSASCSPEPQHCNFLADGICQTATIPSYSVVCQTDSVEIIDFRPSVGNMDIQTSFDVIDEECQTMKTEIFEEETQTRYEEVDDETQTIEATMLESFSQTTETTQLENFSQTTETTQLESFSQTTETTQLESSSQTDSLLSDKSQVVQTIISSIGNYQPVSTQTYPNVSNMEVQTKQVDVNQSETQTAVISPRDFENIETQTVLFSLEETHNIECQTLMTTINNSYDCEVQTNEPEVQSDFTQTSVLALLERDIQTEQMQCIQKTIQTEDNLIEEEKQSQSVDATPSLKTTTVQPDVSMFIIPEEDALRLHQELETRFHVDKGTSMEEKAQKSVESQSKILETEGIGIQVMPSVTTSQTQHNLVCFSDDFTQTDIYMKSKSSQGIMAVCEMLEQEVQVQTKHEDKMLDCDDLNDMTVSDYLVAPTSNLWSDFDRIPEVQDSENSSSNTIDMECQTDLDKKQIEQLIVSQVLVSMKNEQHDRLDQEEIENKNIALKAMIDDFEKETQSSKSNDAEMESMAATRKDDKSSKQFSKLKKNKSSSEHKLTKVDSSSTNDEIFFNNEVSESDDEETMTNSHEKYEMVEKDGKLVKRRVRRRPTSAKSLSGRHRKPSEENSSGDRTSRSYNSLSADEMNSQEPSRSKILKKKHSNSSKQNKNSPVKQERFDKEIQTSLIEKIPLRSAATSPVVFEEMEYEDKTTSVKTGKLSSVVSYLEKSSEVSQTSEKVIGSEDNPSEVKKEKSSTKKKVIRKKKVVPKPEMEEAEVQAVVDTRSLGIGQEGKEDWKEVYLAELNLERRQRMLDIGIQTGVLARVQHMYGKDHESTESELSTSEFPRVNLRKTESSEYVRSQESLARTNSVLSIAESLGGTESSPGPSKPPSRASSFKKTRKSRDLHQDTREQSVADLRSKFEDSQRRPRRPRSSSNER